MSNQNQSPLIPGDDRTARRWMWFGVTFLGAIIFIMWLWSVKLQLTFLDWNKSPEGMLVTRTKDEWDKAFEKNKGESAQEAISKLKDVITRLDAGSNSASTTNNTASTTTNTP